MAYRFRPSGVCASQIEFSIGKDDIIEEVQFTGGCSGNAQGVASLVKGLKVEEVIRRLKGIRCGYKSTSCPDQLAQALQLYLDQKKK